VPCARRSLALLADVPPGTLREVDGLAHGMTACGFCGATAGAGPPVLAWPRFAVCASCAAMVDEIAATGTVGEFEPPPTAT
jgi:hypothetical protein